MTIKQREKLFGKACSAYITEIDVNKYGKSNRKFLKLYDYSCVNEVLRELSNPKCNGVWIMIENVALWFKRKGFVVHEPQPDKVEQNPMLINYWIGYDEEDYPDDL